MGCSARTATTRTRANLLGNSRLGFEIANGRIEIALNIERIHENVRKLRKALKKDEKRPAPGEVHKLRTQARRFEATQEAVSLVPKKDKKQVLWGLKRIRQQAGAVRDMDVLTGHLFSVRVEGEQDRSVQLFEHLGAQR